MKKESNMSNTEITALAREYAEEMIKGKLSEELPNCLKNSMLAMNTEYIAEIFQWLTRRYCLVEKERVKDEYHEAKFTCGNVDPCSDTFVSSLARKSVLERLFPDLGKEVEG